ncbi:RCC1 domain-containing protein [Micromonospora sp. Llam0]|uniref:RCC1 domain-containing protein n=1 Tax=Micromonospora sp. Llam0 TaxID=2485143 RepID=UPI0013157B45|nr:RCC1 domain-containing protein [Micromonospora sp. Llam0]
MLLAMVLVIGDASMGYASEPAERAAAEAAARSAGDRQVPAVLGAVQAIAAGPRHSVALRSDGTVVVWGYNGYEPPGHWSPIPVPVCAVFEDGRCTRLLSGVIAVAAGEFHSLALLRDRTVVAWGFNGGGILGDGTRELRSTPVRVCAVGQVAPCSQFLSGVRSLAAGDLHSVAQLTDGTVVAWGWNFYGQLGDGTTDQRLTPVRVCAVGQVAPCSQFLTGVRSIATGGGHTLAAVDSVLAVAWGPNGSGQLGDGTVEERLTPVRVCAVGQTAPCTRFLNAVKAMAGGDTHSMALLGDGRAVTWGNNGDGQLGDGTAVGRLTPVRVCAMGQTAPCDRFLYGIRHISAGGNHSMAQLSSGGVLTWGANGDGQLGDGTYESRTTPVRVCAVGQAAPCTQFLFQIRAIAAGGYHSLALQPNYTVVAWGLNDLGQLGDGTTETRPIPVQVHAPWPYLS